MKTTLTAYLLGTLTIIFLHACKTETSRPQHSSLKKEPQSYEAIITPRDSTNANEIKDTTKVLKVLYVIQRENANGLENSITDGNIYPYGYLDQVYVVQDTGNWYKIKTNTPYVYNYIEKKLVGEATDIPLDEDELNEGTIEESDTLENIRLSFVPKDTYTRLRKSSNDLFIKGIIHKDADSAFVLKTAVGPVTLKDEGEDSYKYMGEYPYFNAYLVQYACGKCEEYSYELISKKTGKSIHSFPSFPYLSKNHDYIICLGQTFESHTIGLYSCTKDSITSIDHKSFSNWNAVPFIEVSYGEGFWGPDNNFYFSIMTRQLADEFLNKGLDLKTAEGYPLSYVKFDPSKPYMIPKD